MSTTAAEAAAELAAMRASQARLAAAANCPPARHFAFAGLLGALVATPALSLTGAIVAEAFIVAGIALVIRWDRRRTGMFINGYRAGRTRPLTFAMLAIVLGLYTASFWLSRGRDIHWAPLPLAALAALLGCNMSKIWQRIFLRELGVDA
ncbi:hypothetical protein BH09PSE4_BH09PSE4_01670 [soil metagenome]